MPTPDTVQTVRLNDGHHELATKDSLVAAAAVLREFHPDLTYDRLEELRAAGLRVFGFISQCVIERCNCYLPTASHGGTSCMG